MFLCCDIKNVIRNTVATLLFCLLSTTASPISNNNGIFRNNGVIENEIIIQLNGTLYNSGIIHNYNRIVGNGTIIHEGCGEIRDYTENFRQHKPDSFYEGFVTPVGSTVKEQIAGDIGRATYYELVNRETDAARRFLKFQAAIIDLLRK